jgi:hypothetical protein
MMQSLIKNNGQKYETIVVQKHFRENGDIVLKTNDGKGEHETLILKRISNTNNRYFNLSVCDYNNYRYHDKNDQSYYQKKNNFNSINNFNNINNIEQKEEPYYKKNNYTSNFYEDKTGCKNDEYGRDISLLLQNTSNVQPISNQIDNTSNVTNTSISSMSTLLKKRKLINEDTEDGEISIKKETIKDRVKAKTNNTTKDSAKAKTSDTTKDSAKAKTSDTTKDSAKAKTSDTTKDSVKTKTSEIAKINDATKTSENTKQTNIVVDNQTISMSSETYATLMKMIATYTK